MDFRRFCRIATIVFAVFTLYPIGTKLASGHLAHDWAHSALHAASAGLAGYAGWLASSATPARFYTWFIAVCYGVLGLGAWFVDGLLLGTPVAIPLGPVDNVFHLLLAGTALTAIALATRRRAAVATS